MVGWPGEAGTIDCPVSPMRPTGSRHGAALDQVTGV